MEFILPRSISRFFWRLFPFAMLLSAYQNIFNEWKLPLFGFSEFEDAGRLLLVLAISACESAVVVLLAWGVKNLIFTSREED